MALTATKSRAEMSNPTVPGYGDLEKIGAGGFASVYRATQTAVGREVALKLLHHAIADEDTERRFERECVVVGSLSWHPHIAAILDAGVDEDGRRYLAFELLSGGSLGDRLEDSGPIAWSDAVMFGIQTADALAAAHEQDVLHRDVKPDNILLDRLGRAKLADFGIAAMRDGNQTKSGVITATLAHAAPEVLNGKRATKLSDVYLLGSTMFELIIGEPPFGKALGNDFFGAIQRISTEDPPTLTERTDGQVPAALSDLVARCLRKEPAERYASAAELGLALRDLQAAQGRTMTDMPFVVAHQGGDDHVAIVAAPVAEAPPAVPESAPLDQPMGDTGVSALVSEPQADGGLPERSQGSARSAPIAPGRPEPAAATPAPGPEPVAAIPASRPDPTPIDVAPAVSSVPSYDGQTSKPSKSKTPLVVGLVVALAVIGGIVFALSQGGNEPGAGASSVIVAIDAREDDSQGGFTAAFAIDGDLSTGWLSPDEPNGHEIAIGFGKAVRLDSIIIHAGPDPAGSSGLQGSRGLGTTVIGLYEGTSLIRDIRVDLNESAATQTVAINERVTGLEIRSESPGIDPVAIREVEFEGEPLS